jgi:hypothetical protein
LVKSVTHEVMAGWPSHVAGQPRGPASTNFLTSDFLLPPLGECHREADPREAAKWDWPTTPWVH